VGIAIAILCERPRQTADIKLSAGPDNTGSVGFADRPTSAASPGETWTIVSRAALLPAW